MLTVSGAPARVELPPIDSLIAGKPLMLFRRPAEWLSDERAPPVFLASFQIPDLAEVFLFGLRHDLSLLRESREGYVVEFFVVLADRSAGWRVHRLNQNAGPNYAEGNERADYVPATAVKSPELRSLGTPPQWKKHAAFWPTLTGKPMTFVGQVGLPKTKITSQFLTWDCNLYLFWSGDPPDHSFKVCKQQAKFQSAQDHYRAEARRWRRNRQR